MAHSHSHSKEHEIEFQARRAAQIEVSPTAEKVLERYRTNRHWRYIPKEYVFKKLGDVSGKTVCDFGCGEGVITSQLARFGARVTSIDISPDLIKVARKRAELDRVAERVEFIVADAEELDMPESKFDSIVAYDVLHHVELDKVMPKLLASLKPGGRLVIVDPIACSAVLRKMRNMTPVEIDGDSGDHQLDGDDIDRIRSYFESSTVDYFRLVGRFERLFRMGTPLHGKVNLVLSMADRVLLALVPPLRKFCGTVVITGDKAN